jgi:hypothetical protein
MALCGQAGSWLHPPARSESLQPLRQISKLSGNLAFLDMESLRVTAIRTKPAHLMRQVTKLLSLSLTHHDFTLPLWKM